MKIVKDIFNLKFLIFFVLVTGCDSSEEYQPSKVKLLPSSIIRYLIFSDLPDPSHSSTSWILEYDSQNRISCMQRDDEGDNYSTTHTFLYDGYDITEVLTRSNNPNYSKTYKYVFKGEFIEIEGGGSISIDNELREVGVIYDNNGNVTISQGKIFEYDHENGVFKYVNMPSWFLSMRFGFVGRNIYNNCSYEKEDGIQHEYVMEYNSDNYPTYILKRGIDLIGGSFVRYNIGYVDSN